MADEMRPCPFCGGEARICAKHFTDGTAYAWVECGRCHAKSRRSDFSEDLALAWNARAERTCHRKAESQAHICSECCCPLPEWRRDNYCPNCGAKVVDDD